MPTTLEELTVTEQQMLGDWLKRVEEKLDSSIHECGICRERLVRVEDSAKAAHHRLDDAGRGGMKWGEKLALVLAGCAGLGAAVKAFFFAGVNK